MQQNYKDILGLRQPNVVTCKGKMKPVDCSPPCAPPPPSAGDLAGSRAPWVKAGDMCVGLLVTGGWV